MFEVFEAIRKRAAVSPKRIVFPGSGDGRILEAAGLITREGIAHPVLLGDSTWIKERARESGVGSAGFEVCEPERRKIEAYASMLGGEWKAKGIRKVEACRRLEDLTEFAAAMVRSGDADGLVAGPPTDEQASDLTSTLSIGLSSEISIMCRFFLVALPAKNDLKGAGLLFADSGSVGAASPSQLANIAINAARRTRQLLGCEPRVQFLTLGVVASLQTRNRYESAETDLHDRVVRAIETIEAREVGLLVDRRLHTEVPYPGGTSGSEPDSSAPPNTFVLPDMQAGNFGYQLHQLFPGSQVVGPLLQGLVRPANEVGVECSVKDIVNITAITALS